MANRERYGCKRTSRTRPVLPVIVVVCDDTRTAVAYFTVLKHAVKDRRVVNVYPAPREGATGSDVIEFATAKAPDNGEASDRIFVLVDFDSNPDAATLRHEGTKSSIAVLFSNPCFEVWTLAHLEDTGEMFINCGTVLKRVREQWKTQFGVEIANKAQADYHKLLDRVATAISRCERRDPSTNPSWTEVWVAAKAIFE